MVQVANCNILTSYTVFSVEFRDGVYTLYTGKGIALINRFAFWKSTWCPLCKGIKYSKPGWIQESGHGVWWWKGLPIPTHSFCLYQSYNTDNVCISSCLRALGFHLIALQEPQFSVPSLSSYITLCSCCLVEESSITKEQRNGWRTMPIIQVQYSASYGQDKRNAMNNCAFKMGPHQVMPCMIHKSQATYSTVCTTLGRLVIDF